jgi:hypothetical protein
MSIEPKLVSNLQIEVRRTPPDFETTRRIISELTGVDEEPSLTKVTQVVELLSQSFLSEVAKLIAANENTREGKTIKPNKLALLLRQNTYLLNDFDVVADENGENLKIHYKGKSDTVTVYKAYDYLRLELARFVGYREFDNRTISRAIMQAKNYLEYDKDFIDCNIADALVVEKAYALFYSRGNRKNITIPELKRTIDSVELTTKEIQDILLNAGWEYTTSGTCPTKFFKPKQ